MKASNTIAGFLSIVLLCIWVSAAKAQTADTLKATEVKVKPTESKPMPPLKFTPSLYFVPYYYSPKPLSVTLTDSHLPTTNMLLLKSSTTYNALNSINQTLTNDRKKEKGFAVAGVAVSAAIFGGVIYQAINGKHFSKEAQQRREQLSKPPVKK